MSGGSLREYDRIADRIKLARQVSTRPVLVVEGKDDRRFLGRLPHLSAVEFYIAFTRNKVISTATDICTLGLDDVVCIVDRDFDEVVADAEAHGLAVVAYENADLESMLWNSVALDQLIDEVGSDDKVDRFGGPVALRNRAFEVLAPLTKLRRANAVNGWGIDFKALDISSKLNVRTLTLGEQALCDALWHAELGVQKADLYAVVSAAELPPACPSTGLDLIRGRDALAVTGVALRRLIGSLSHQQASVDRLEETLRLTADIAAVDAHGWLDRLTKRLSL